MNKSALGIKNTRLLTMVSPSTYPIGMYLRREDETIGTITKGSPTGWVCCANRVGVSANLRISFALLDNLKSFTACMQFHYFR